MNEEDKHFLNASHRKCILLSGRECHIINYLQTELAWAVPGNIDPRSFSYGPSAARSVLSLPIFPVRPSRSVSKRLLLTTECENKLQWRPQKVTWLYIVFSEERGLSKREQSQNKLYKIGKT